MTSQSQENAESQAVMRTFDNPMEYLTNVLKAHVGSSEDFLAFERTLFYQNAELKSFKATCEELRATVTKLQEEKRSLELQLVTEKAQREQEYKNSALELEKLNIQQNAQIYTMKCEVESWKRKFEAVTTESTWMKDQLKAVEIEKNHALQKVAELKASASEVERCRQSLESYTRRLKATVQNATTRLEEVEQAKIFLEELTESNQKQVNAMSFHLTNWASERSYFQEKVSRLESELVEAKAELVQNDSRSRELGAEMTERKFTELVNMLFKENKDLHEGLSILSKAIGNQITETDQLLVQKTGELHEAVQDAYKRLQLKESDFLL